MHTVFAEGDVLVCQADKVNYEDFICTNKHLLKEAPSQS